MKRIFAMGQIKTQARILSGKLLESVNTSYGVVDFAKGTPLKRTLGTRVINMMDGGLNIRYYFDGRIAILCRLVISYPVSIKAISESVTNNIEYLVNKYGFKIKLLEVLIDAMK